MINQAERNPVRQWLFLVIVFCCAFFVNNKAIFVDIMESRNLITAREMVYDGNWLTPTMNGELRLEKPPLPTWIAAAVEWVSPDNIGLQRAVAGMAAVLLAVFLYLLAVRLTRDRLYAFIAVLLLCTSYSIVLMGRTASWDIYCHAFMIVAIYYLYKALQASTCRWSWFTIAGVMMGLSFLGKGPVSFYALLLPFLCAYGLYYKVNLTDKWKGGLWMLFLTLLISSWWYVYIYVSHPEMMEYVLKKESGSWMNYNVRPWWYYWKFFLETGAWSLLTLTALLVPVWRKRLADPKPYYFVLVWMLFVLFFLSLIPEKKSRYLLPVVIPAVLTGAHLFVYWIEQMKVDDRLGRLLYRMNAGLILLVTCALPFLLYRYVYSEMHMGLGAYLFLSLLCIGIGVGVFYAFRKVRPYTFLLGVVGLMMIAELFMMPYIGSFVTNKERKSISLTRDIKALKPLPFYQDSRDTLRIELVYAAYKKILKIDLSDTLQVRRSLPFVLVSKEKAEEVLPEYVLDKVELTPIDRYNDNPWPKGHRRYTEDFINYVTVIREKKDDEQDE